MTKLYTLILALLFYSIAFTQNGSVKGFEILKGHLSPASEKEVSVYTPQKDYKKAPGDVFWSEDFTGGFPAGWSVYDSTGNNYNWAIQAVGTLPDAEFSTGLTTINSSSGGNCMLLYSDFYNTPIPAGGSIEMNSFFQTSAITLNNSPGVTVEFQQSFRWCCDISNSKAVLAVSTDSTFSTNVMEYFIKGGIDNNIASPDPMNMSINISAIAANYTGDIYLRFHVKNGISHYYWMIDDIQVVESPINDLQVSNGFYGLDGYQYSAIPYSQVQPMDFSITSFNHGSANQTGANLTVDVKEWGTSIFTGSSNDTALNSLSIDTFNLNNFWTPPNNPGNWGDPLSITLDVFSDSLDENQNNNSISFPTFRVTNDYWAHDDFSTSPGNAGGYPGPNGATEYEAGNYFKCLSSDIVYGIGLVTGTNTPVGTFIESFIYEVDYSQTPEDYIEIYRSPGYMLTATDIGTNHYFLTWQAPPYLTGGKTYFVGVHSFIDYEYAISGTNPSPNSSTPVHSAIRYPNMGNPSPNSSFILTETPMIRLNFSTVCGINESTSPQLTISPNPTTGKFTISLDSEKEESYSLSITNALGQEILNKTIHGIGKTEEEFSLEGYDKGVYFINLTGKSGTKTSKLIVE